MENYTALNNSYLLLEAEVPPKLHLVFEGRYLEATGDDVSPGRPVHYQNQPNKWGAELRVYFNDSNLFEMLKSTGVYVEFPRNGYMAGEYKYRFNDNVLWWKFVDFGHLRLGRNGVVIDNLLLLLRPNAV